jgi:hypothetical protein
MIKILVVFKYTAFKMKRSISEHKFKRIKQNISQQKHVNQQKMIGMMGRSIMATLTCTVKFFNQKLPLVDKIMD